MKVTRDVILDLWPVYEAGEAHPDTRTLVEEFLAQNPDLRETLRSADARDDLRPVGVALAPERQRETLRLTQELLWRRTSFLAWAIGCMGLASFSTRFPRLTGVFMWGDYNMLPLFLLGASALLWVSYFRMRQRLKVEGL